MDNAEPMGDSAGQTDPLSLDTIFDILSNSRRRAAIRHLNAHGDGPIRLRDLAEQIAAWENDVSVQEVTYRERKRVYTSLYQSHLLKMDKLGTVKYDRDRGTIERTRATQQLGHYLDLVSGDERSWNGLPLAVAVVCAAFVVAAWVDVYPSGTLTGPSLALVAAGVVVLVSGALFLSVR